MAMAIAVGSCAPSPKAKAGRSPYKVEKAVMKDESDVHLPQPRKKRKK
jgi:hypothetical protein